MGRGDVEVCMAGESRARRAGGRLPVQCQPCRSPTISAGNVSYEVCGDRINRTNEKQPRSMLMKLADLATLIRSKNAGPFFLTFDIMFADEEHYQLLKTPSLLDYFPFPNLSIS